MSSQDKTHQDPALSAVTVLSVNIIDTVATQPGEGPRATTPVDVEKHV